MTTLAGSKVRRWREAQRPRVTREALASRLGTNASRVQGWEEDGKRPSDPGMVNQLAADGIATHADWFRPAICALCELGADDARVLACVAADCPLLVRRQA